MINKYYNLTQQANEGVRDKAPEWMDKVFETDFEKVKSDKKSNPFEGIKDPILNPTNAGVKKTYNCQMCGMPLEANEVGVCSNCN